MLLNRGFFVYIFLFNTTLLLSQSSQDIIKPNIVVLDPGHGGKNVQPFSLYGDKYDKISGKYTDAYRPGAFYKGLWEHEETYKISKLINKILDLTLLSKDHQQFKKILNKYTNQKIEKIYPIKSFLSRNESYFSQYSKIEKDPNAPYRLYDYPDIKTKEFKKGTITRINDLKPELTVTIHLTRGNVNKYGAMNAVITPSYKTYKQAIDYVQNSKNRNNIKNQFLKSPYKNWFLTQGRNNFESFLNDAWIYFTGYWSTTDGLNPSVDEFYGYRYNMFNWAYQDNNEWVNIARKHPINTQYTNHLKYFTPIGKYWQREKSIEEEWKRENGYDNFGGDNFYAAQELLRYIRKGFKVIKNEPTNQLPAIMNPYISTWAIPSYINSISAYLEIGYLDIDKDYNRILNNKNVYAESIAAGIYSLFFALEQKNNIEDMPKGKSINFKKYKSYFNKATLNN